LIPLPGHTIPLHESIHLLAIYSSRWGYMTSSHLSGLVPLWMAHASTHSWVSVLPSRSPWPGCAPVLHSSSFIPSPLSSDLTPCLVVNSWSWLCHLPPGKPLGRNTPPSSQWSVSLQESAASFLSPWKKCHSSNIRSTLPSTVDLCSFQEPSVNHYLSLPPTLVF
jgi:hypothetical protein